VRKFPFLSLSVLLAVGAIFLSLLAGTTSAVAASLGTRTSVTPPTAASVPAAVPKGVESTLDPAGPLSSYLSAAACSSGRACVAVGNYINRNGTAVTLAEAWKGKKWAIETTPTSGFNSGLSGVSCTSASACTAVGSYQPNPEFQIVVTLAEVWNGTKWVIEQTPDPTGARYSNLDAVSCTSVTTCTAVGYYQTGEFENTDRPLVEAWNGTRWRIERAPTPTGATGVFLTGVSCSSAVACTAVGSYVNSIGSVVSLAEAWHTKKWTIEATPNLTGAQQWSLSGVSCTSASACTAVGTSIYVTLAEVWNGKKWVIERTPNPTGAQYSHLSGVSCSSATACTAVGYYQTGENAIGRTLAEAWNGRMWRVKPTSTPNRAYQADLSGVSCSSATACTVVGSYTNSVGRNEKLVTRFP